jgi:hypothetical protein
MRRLRPFVILALPLLLIGCTRLGERLGFREPDVVLVGGGPVCPSTAVLSDAVTVTKLKPGTPTNAQNPANVVLAAEMSQAQLECDYDGDTNSLTIDIDFAVRAMRGAAAMGDNPQLDYFVAIIDAQGNLLTKNIFSSQPDIGGQMEGVYTQSVNNFVFKMGMDMRPIDYQLLTGFQLTPAELAYNRIPRPLPQPQPQTQTQTQTQTQPQPRP